MSAFAGIQMAQHLARLGQYSSRIFCTVRSWSVESGECLRVFGTGGGPKNPLRHNEWIYDIHELNGIIWTGSRDDMAIAWDEFSGDALRSFSGKTDPEDEDTYSIYAIQIIDSEPFQ